MVQLFFELLQVALGLRATLSRSLSDEEWKKLFDICQQQTVAGVVIPALDILSRSGQRPPLPVLYEWIGLSEQIKINNLLANKRSSEVVRIFQEAGFKSCILKGQGNGLMYSTPLLRQCGDIDIWVDGNKEDIVSFVENRTPSVKAKYHHVDFPIFKDISVEVHYIPAFLNIPWCNNRLQGFFSDLRNQQFDNFQSLPEGAGKIPVPTIEFNIVFQMAHMMRHFMSEGIGIRHLMDYYYLLLKAQAVNLNDNWENIFNKLGMNKFATGAMWLMKECFGLDERYMIVPENKKTGELLLKEILNGGNFGRNDQRFAKRMISPFSTNLSVMIRNTNIMRTFPMDSFFAPIMNVWHGIRERGDGYLFHE